LRDLYRCLGDHPEALIRAIADSWGIEIARGAPLDQIRVLGDAMLATDALESIVATLSPEATRALTTIASHDGVLPAHRLLGYGTIQRYGPARLAREHPWTHPQNALEQLYYRGLLYRSYGSTDDQIGPVLVIPHQILDRLRPLLTQQASLPVKEVPPEAIARTHSAGDALCEDILAFLAHVRQRSVRVQGSPAEHESPPFDTREMDLGPRLLGQRSPERLEFMQHLLWRRDLVEPDRGRLRPSLRARDWLRLPDIRRRRDLLGGWQNDTSWSELARLPHIRVEQPVPDALIVRARHALLNVLATCETDTWLSLQSFVAILKQERPDYLRPGGDYDTWPIRETRSGEYLAGFEHWDDVEGALARHCICRSLHWLGLVDLGYNMDHAVVGFRLSPLTLDLIAAEPQRLASGTRAESVTTAQVDKDMTVHISLADSMYDRYQLERFAEWEEQTEEAVYRITSESLWRGMQTDIRVDQILGFLRRVTGQDVPSEVEETLRAWEKHGRAALSATIILETLDAETMDQILTHQDTGYLIRRRLSATVSTVDEKNLETLIQRLRSLDIWPSVLLRGQTRERS